MARKKYAAFANVQFRNYSYKYHIVTEPSIVRTSGKEKRTIIPSPVLHLQVFDDDTGKDITEHVLLNYFVIAKLLGERDSIKVDSNLLIGTTVVSGDFVRVGEQRYLLFNFNNLGLTSKGNYRLKFSLFESDGLTGFKPRVKHLDTAVSDVFTCYSTRMFYTEEVNQKRIEILSGITEINNNELTVSDSLLPKLENVAMKRQRRGSHSRPGSRSSFTQIDLGSEPDTRSNSRKRVSISIGDDSTDILSKNNFDLAYIADQIYPSSPKKKSRSPSVVSNHDNVNILDPGMIHLLPNIVTTNFSNSDLQFEPGSRPGSSDGSFYSAMEYSNFDDGGVIPSFLDDAGNIDEQELNRVFSQLSDTSAHSLNVTEDILVAGDFPANEDISSELFMSPIEPSLFLSPQTSNEGNSPLLKPEFQF